MASRPSESSTRKRFCCLVTLVNPPKGDVGLGGRRNRSLLFQVYLINFVFKGVLLLLWLIWWSCSWDNFEFGISMVFHRIRWETTEQMMNILFKRGGIRLKDQKQKCFVFETVSDKLCKLSNTNSAFFIKIWNPICFPEEDHKWYYYSMTNQLFGPCLVRDFGFCLCCQYTIAASSDRFLIFVPWLMMENE